jgi:hypothetical protein
MDKKHLDLYTDYLLSTFGYATATGLERMMDGDISHDQITRFLSQETYTSKDLWLQVKPTVREVESEEGVLIFDDTVQEKPYTDENELMCWHYDHSKGRSVQGFNLLNCLYHVEGASIPVAFEAIKKPVQYSDLKTKRRKRKSLITKNELMRQMIKVCIQNQLKFQFVLFDIWFASVENMRYIKERLEKDFVCALKANRLVALSEEDQTAKRFVRIDALTWSEEMIFTVWLKDVPFPVEVVRQVFENKDGSTGILYLACSDTAIERDAILTVYKKRWPIEIFHKSLKQNAALGKAPVRRVRTQNNHIFAALYAVFKLECLKIKYRLNHFALRSKIYLKALRSAYDELQLLKTA